jgi:pimeloyl-ACP methyl ester carboxylesterase
MADTISNNFISINNKQLFYKSAGQGPSILLLHPTPRSSSLMEPLMQLLAPYYTVLAIDLPGYGQSQSLNEPIQGIQSYLPTIHNFILSQNIKHLKIYGTATGAQLAIAYGLQYANYVSHLYLDNAAHFTETQYEGIMEKYFIDITPKVDGSHLKTLWEHVVKSSQYFPWYSQLPEDCFSTHPAPEAILQSIFNDYLLAGPNYADAYKAAFAHERATHVQALHVPTTIFNWEGSPIKKYIAQLVAHKFANNIKVVITPADFKQRYQVMIDYMCK